VVVDVNLIASGVVAVLFVVTRTARTIPGRLEHGAAVPAQRPAATAPAASATHRHPQRPGGERVPRHARPPRWMRRPLMTWLRRSRRGTP
jgi:hypothetical protein